MMDEYISLIIKEEKDFNTYDVKNVLFTCPNCLKTSLVESDIVPCRFCGSDGMSLSFYELLWDCVHYGWTCRIAYENEYKMNCKIKQKPIFPEPDERTLFLATLIIYEKYSLLKSAVSMDSSIFAVPEFALFQKYILEYFMENKTANLEFEI